MIKTIREFLAFQKEKTKLDKFVDYAINSDKFYCSPKFLLPQHQEVGYVDVDVPSSIRQGYFNIFSEMIQAGTLTIAPQYLNKEDPYVEMVGLDSEGVKYMIFLTEDSVTLQINDLYSDGPRDDSVHGHVGSFSTYLDNEDFFTTKADILEDGVERAYLDLQQPTHHKIKSIADKIRNSKSLPHLRWDDYIARKDLVKYAR